VQRLVSRGVNSLKRKTDERGRKANCAAGMEDHLHLNFRLAEKVRTIIKKGIRQSKTARVGYTDKKERPGARGKEYIIMKGSRRTVSNCERAAFNRERIRRQSEDNKRLSYARGRERWILISTEGQISSLNDRGIKNCSSIHYKRKGEQEEHRSAVGTDGKKGRLYLQERFQKTEKRSCGKRRGVGCIRGGSKRSENTTEIRKISLQPGIRKDLQNRSTSRTGVGRKSLRKKPSEPNSAGHNAYR